MNALDLIAAAKARAAAEGRAAANGAVYRTVEAKRWHDDFKAARDAGTLDKAAFARREIALRNTGKW